MSTHEDMLKIIYDRVLPEMQQNGIEDTTENRISFLQGLRAAWSESNDVAALPWIYTLNREILRLAVEKMSENFKLH